MPSSRASIRISPPICDPRRARPSKRICRSFGKMAYDPRGMSVDIERQIRRLILALLTFGLTATVVDLFGLSHYEETLQILPIAFIFLCLLVVIWHVISGSTASLQSLKILMPLMILVGLIGVVLHMRGSLAFQLEANPDLGRWELIKKILHAKAPPALAPGIMVQLGLLGSIYGYKHPGGR